MAEAVFAKQVEEQGLDDQFERIDSCGTAGYHVGEPPDARSAAECQRHGVPVHHKARRLNASDFKTFTHIMCMDEANVVDVKRQLAKTLLASPPQILLFGSFDPKGELIIKDPYYGGNDGFKTNYLQCVRCSQGFLRHLGLC
ncbi:hypothetical protein HDV03_002343 [Kappamyces sp. JEL0829]|nr:hypothetical protein HDV03_002343 [Kappamyces sp. JEL0829]